MAKSAEATGYAHNLEAIAVAISDDDELTDKTQADVPGTIRSIAEKLDKGVVALSNAELSIRGRLGGAAI